MPSKYGTFDRDKLRRLPLAQRSHDMDLTEVLEVGEAPVAFEHPALPAVADALVAARRRGASVVLLMGAHVIKQGLSRYVIDFLRRGWVSVMAANGACTIHDYELARIGATTESVARYLSEGQFGLWTETGELNEIVKAGNAHGLGFGESVGKAISESDLPHKDVSVFAAAYEASVPATVHVGIGYDIVHEHPNFDGAAAGRASDRDFLILTRVLESLAGGVVLCWGSAVMGPEVFLKGLAMARNVAHQEGRAIRQFTSAVFDLVNLPGDLRGEAAKDSPEYYFRPYKTLLVRTVRDGGTGHYIRGDHRASIPALHKLLLARFGQ
ncbi:MAG TPA: hypothetical protein VMZ50_00035 [Phycisphaerae bacterium]|nr:hypothetical protein [Phycisphaerae bacterium]